MKKPIKLKESDLTKIVKRIMSEQSPGNADQLRFCECADWDGTTCATSEAGVQLGNGNTWSNTGNAPQVGDVFQFFGNWNPGDKIVTCAGINCPSSGSGGPVGLNQQVGATCGGSGVACPTCIDIDYCDCADWDGTTCTGVTMGVILKPTYTNTGAVPQAGDVYTSGNSPDRYIMTATPNTDPNNMGTWCDQSVGVTCGGTTGGTGDCCDWCQTQTGGNPPIDCYDWMCDDPDYCGDSGGGREVYVGGGEKKPIKLKESDLTKIVKKIMSEQLGGPCVPWTQPPMGGCPQGETWNGYPVCECEPTPPQEWCCIGGGFPGSQMANCVQMNVGQCNPNSPMVNSGPFPTYQDCDDSCWACTPMTGPPPGGCPQGETWNGYPDCECVTAPPPPPSGPLPKKVWFEPCKWDYNPVTIDRTKKMTIDGQTPQVGDIFEIDLGPQDGFWNPSMNGAFVPMRVVQTAFSMGWPFGQTNDFDPSHCKTRGPIPTDPHVHAKVAQGGDKDGWIDETEGELPPTGDEMAEPIKLKESDLIKIVKRLIHEQTNPFSGGGSGPNWDAAQAAWTNWNSETQGGAPQADATFLSNMAGKGCGFYEKRLRAQVNSFVSQFGGTFGSGANQTNTSGGMNPAWQSQKYARIMWLSDKVQDCNSTSSNVSQCIIDFIDNPANDGPLDSATCNGSQAISAKNKENTKFRHRSIADCGMLDNKISEMLQLSQTTTGCEQIRKEAKHDWLTNLKNSCC